MGEGQQAMLLDDFLPSWHFVERHRTLVQAAPERVMAALLAMNLRQAPLSRLLFALRELPWRLARRDFSTPGLGFTMEDMLKLGFIDLGRSQGEELVLGLVAQPWRFKPDIRRVAPAQFIAFDQPGYVKVAANFRVDPQADLLTRLSTETRVFCLGGPARLAFGLYWALIRPGSGLIRRDMLRLAKRAAEAGR